MPRITTEQYQIFNIAQRDEFIVRLDKFLKEEVGVDFPVDPDDSFALADEIVLRAETLGIHSEIGIAYYAILVCHFGFMLQRIADRPWFSVLNKGRGEVVDPDWIERVYITIIECLKLD